MHALFDAMSSNTDLTVAILLASPFAAGFLTLALLWPLVRRRSRRAKRLVFAASSAVPELAIWLYLVQSEGWRITPLSAFIFVGFATIPVSVYVATVRSRAEVHDRQLALVREVRGVLTEGATYRDAIVSMAGSPPIRVHSRLQIGMSGVAVAGTLAMGLLALEWHFEMLGDGVYVSAPWFAYGMLGLIAALVAAYWAWIILEALVGTWTVYASRDGVSVAHDWLGHRFGEKTIAAREIRCVSGGQIPGAAGYAKAVVVQTNTTKSITLLGLAGLRQDAATSIAKAIGEAVGVSGEASTSDSSPADAGSVPRAATAQRCESTPDPRSSRPQAHLPNHRATH